MSRPTDHDAYIAKAPEYAVPILEKLRKAVHKACPDVEESIKWSAPHFDYHGILIGVAAFKQHVRVAFWRGKHMQDSEGLLEVIGTTDMAALTAQKASELPPQKVLTAYIKEAMQLNETAASAPAKPGKRVAKKQTAKRTLSIPPDLEAALAKHKQARKTFDEFSYSNRKEYIEWITEAKREATRAKRVATAIEYLREGKPRNWKYMKEWR